MLKKIVDSDVIKISNSPWYSPVVLKQKKNEVCGTKCCDQEGCLSAPTN